LDQYVKSGRTDHRADRMHPRTAVAPHGGEERQADVPLIELAATGFRQVRPLRRELAPCQHERDRTEPSLTPAVSIPFLLAKRSAKHPPQEVPPVAADQ